MEWLKKALKSRTLWTIAAAFVISGTQGVTHFMPDALAVMVSGVLSLVAGYFKLNPSQEYGK